MAIESFDVEDENGVRVTGTVEAYRKRDGDYYNPNSPSFRNERHADVDINYLNTRDVCRIDPNKLKEAVADAFARALVRFGIPDPKMDNVEQKVGELIKATRQQCALNPDKYVSNQNSLAVDGRTGRLIGDVTATAYAAVPDGSGGVQAVVAHENSWPAKAMSDFRNQGADGRFAQPTGADGTANIGDGNYRSTTVGVPSSPTFETQTSKGSTVPYLDDYVRYLNQKAGNISEPPATGSAISATSFAPSQMRNPSGSWLSGVPGGVAQTGGGNGIGGGWSKLAPAVSNIDPASVRRLSSPLLGIVPVGPNQPTRDAGPSPFAAVPSLSSPSFARSALEALLAPDARGAAEDWTSPPRFRSVDPQTQDAPGGLPNLLMQIGVFDSSNPDQPPTRAPIRYLSQIPQDGVGDIPGLMFGAAGTDLASPTVPSGGLPGLIEDYMRRNPDGNAVR
jgi:hypothetical protein